MDDRSLSRRQFTAIGAAAGTAMPARDLPTAEAASNTNTNDEGNAPPRGMAISFRAAASAMRVFVLAVQVFAVIAGTAAGQQGASATRSFVPIPPGEPRWDRTNPDSAIYLPHGDDDGCNQQVVGVVTIRGTLLVTWTMASREGKPDQRVVVARSCDDGRTWSKPTVLDRDEKENPGLATYGVLFQVPATGRIYLFYLKNDGRSRVRPDITGFFRWQYSDDDGRSWQTTKVRFDMGKGEWTDAVPDTPGNFIGIYSPHITGKGNVLFSFARYGLAKGLKGYESWMTEVYFLRMDNILTESDPNKLVFTVLPRAPQGLRIKRKGQGGAELFWGNEPSWIELTDGRLITAIRTRNGAIYYALSQDQGETWTRPEPLLNHDRGEPLKNPSAPCPMLRLHDGRIVLLFYNQPPDSTFGPRTPAYLVVGRETLQRRQPIEFGEPVKFMEVSGVPKQGTTYLQIASYSSLVEHGGKVLLFYNDCKHWVLFKAIAEDFLKPRFPE
jgi:hypothetical protein